MEKGAGNYDKKPEHDEQLEIARKMREALVKAAPIGGLPKVLRRMIPFSAWTRR